MTTQRDMYVRKMHYTEHIIIIHTSSVRIILCVYIQITPQFNVRPAWVPQCVYVFNFRQVTKNRFSANLSINFNQYNRIINKFSRGGNGFGLRRSNALVISSMT